MLRITFKNGTIKDFNVSFPFNFKTIKILSGINCVVIEELNVLINMSEVYLMEILDIFGENRKFSSDEWPNGNIFSQFDDSEDDDDISFSNKDDDDDDDDISLGKEVDEDDIKGDFFNIKNENLDKNNVDDNIDFGNVKIDPTDDLSVSGMEDFDIRNENTSLKDSDKVSADFMNRPAEDIFNSLEKSVSAKINDASDDIVLDD